MYRTLVFINKYPLHWLRFPISNLGVEFTSGDVYQYFNVPEYLFQRIFTRIIHTAQFLNDNIRYNYRYQKVS